jgi:hypothetical protein
MNVKVKLNSFSVVVLEQSQDAKEMKFYEFNKDSMQEHFCYFEDNFFIFILYNLNIQYDNKKKLVSLTLDEMCLNYIEYISKMKKEEEIELIQRKGSEYSECNEGFVFKSNEMFHSVAEDNMFDVKQYYCSYDYKYNKNQILLIKNLNFGFNFSSEDNKKINFDLNSFIVNLHPVLLFKLLKILYDNSYLIKEVLFYNYDQMKDEIKKNKDKKDVDDIIDTNKKKEEKDSDINLSFLSFEEFEDDNEDKDDNKIINKNEANNDIYSSDLLFEDDKPKEEINSKIQNVFKTLNIEIKIRTIEIKIISFK